MFLMRSWHDNENVVESITIICSNCGKETGLSMKNMNTNYKELITKFVLNTMLHHVDISWIIETNKHVLYDIDKHNPD